MTFTVTDGIAFFEDIPQGADKGAAISATIGGGLRNAQLASLRDVKVALAAECKRRGGRSIVGFEYGQRSVGMFASIFSRDDVNWYGRGYVSQFQPPQR